MNPGLKNFIKSWLITTFAVLVTVSLPFTHIRCEEKAGVIVAALLLGVLNAFIRPFMLLLALPLVILSLGLFLIVINACLLYLVQAIMQTFGLHLTIENFGWAMLGSVIISVVSLPLKLMTGSANATIKVQRQQRPPGSNSGGGDGPVIDV